MRRLLHRLRAAWRVVGRSRRLEREMRDELAFHLDMEAERLAAQGLDAAEARRQAAIRFGGVEAVKERGRDARGFRWLDAVSIDARLGARMLVKYRGLTVVGGFAMAVAIAIGATGYEIIGEILTPSLPFADGRRIVEIELFSPNPPLTHGLRIDFAAGRVTLTGVDEIGAWGTVRRNLVSRRASPGPVRVAQMSASGFRMAGVAPLHGRYLLPSDEDPAADPVVVLGYREWQRRFASDPSVVGERITLGGVPTLVVGIMPEGFEFPFDHQYWMPLKPRFAGPGVAAYHLFARLAPGVSIERAQSELQSVVRSITADWPVAEGKDFVVVPGQVTSAKVLPYTHAQVDLTSPTAVWLIRGARVLASILTIAVALNLAILFYARTVTRAGEIAVRTALGASRRRILAQLFVEALALSLVGAAGGLVLSRAALGAIQSFRSDIGGVPFWIRFELSASTTVAALVLAAIAALVMGVLPGLTITGRRLYARLQLASQRGGTRLGRVWTTLVVAQVALAVSLLPAGLYLATQVAQLEMQGPGFAADRFGIGVINPEAVDETIPLDRLARRNRELVARVAAEPGVDAVTLSSSVPGFSAGARVAFENPERVTVPGPWDVSWMDVAPDLFDVYGAELVAGRTFAASDAADSGVVIVNQTFARWLSGGGALGARFRDVYIGSARGARSSYEVVGVVRDFPRFPHLLNLDTPAVVYRPASPGQLRAVVVSARFPDRVPEAFGARVRQIAAEIDPSLQVPRAMALSTHYGELVRLWRYVATALALATLSVLLLSAAGMYALMSVTIAQRTREIGIRIALGAPPLRLLGGVLAGVARRVSIGVACGLLLGQIPMVTIGLPNAMIAPLASGVGIVVVLLALSAAYGPARRALRIDPNDALRAEG
jgi:predicted permease